MCRRRRRTRFYPRSVSMSRSPAGSTRPSAGPAAERPPHAGRTAARLTASRRGTQVARRCLVHRSTRPASVHRPGAPCGALLKSALRPRYCRDSSVRRARSSHDHVLLALVADRGLDGGLLPRRPAGRRASGPGPDPSTSRPGRSGAVSARQWTPPPVRASVHPRAARAARAPVPWPVASSSPRRGRRSCSTPTSVAPTPPPHRPVSGTQGSREQCPQSPIDSPAGHPPPASGNSPRPPRRRRRRCPPSTR